MVGRMPAVNLGALCQGRNSVAASGHCRLPFTCLLRGLKLLGGPLDLLPGSQQLL